MDPVASSVDVSDASGGAAHVVVPAPVPTAAPASATEQRGKDDLDEDFQGRKLATVRRVKAVRPIEGASMVEVAEVDGWQVVAKVGEFKPGDLCVYFEIDSFLPIAPHFEFLRKACFKVVPDLGEGFRLKTIKLRGELSQGLAIPLTSVPLSLPNPVVGMDLTEVLGVRKYEPPLAAFLEQRPGAQPRAQKSFPTFLRRTDQERIQNCFDELLARPDIAELRFEVTMKLDGSSVTAYLKDGVFGICSRNLEVLPDDTNMYWTAMRRACMEERLRHVGRNIAVQGELMGPGVQKNRERVAEYTFFLFAAFDIDAQRYLIPSERLALLAALNAVPLTEGEGEGEGSVGAVGGGDQADKAATVSTQAAVEESATGSTSEKKKGRGGKRGGASAGAEPQGSARGTRGWNPDGPGVKHVPILDENFNLAQFGGSIAAALAYADIPSVVHPVAEGVVLKCTTHAHPTFKIINNKFLLKCEE